MRWFYLNSILTLKNIKKEFHHTVVLKDISFDIPKGSIFAFLGSNGAGKSTLLNIIIQVLLPTSGKILMNGQKVLKNKIGVVFQENTFDDELTIYENMMIRGSLYNIKNEILQEKILEIVTELGINSFLHTKYKYCSGGQKRIAMIARALLITPEIIIMDEPTTALDIETRKKLWDFLLKLNKEKKLTIFFSSHYIEEAEVATNLCVLKSGKIIFNGTYQDLISNYSKKQLKINLKDITINKEISSVEKALFYLKQLDYKKIDTFSLANSNLEEIFLKLVYNENTNL